MGRGGYTSSYARSVWGGVGTLRHWLGQRRKTRRLAGEGGKSARGGVLKRPLPGLQAGRCPLVDPPGTPVVKQHVTVSEWGQIKTTAREPLLTALCSLKNARLHLATHWPYSVKSARASTLTERVSSLNNVRRKLRVPTLE